MKGGGKQRRGEQVGRNNSLSYVSVRMFVSLLFCLCHVSLLCVCALIVLWLHFMLHAISQDETEGEERKGGGILSMHSTEKLTESLLRYAPFLILSKLRHKLLLNFH